MSDLQGESTASAGDGERAPLPATSIRERDIDLLILEELRASPAFCRLLVSKLSRCDPLEEGAEFETSTRISVETAGPGAGETDIECVLKTTDRTVYILIENKIGADYQPLQLERYAERAEVLRMKEVKAFTLLLAPRSYGKPTSPVDGHLTYEEIRDHFSSRANGEGDELRARLQTRAAIMAVAIRRAEEGYQRRADAVTTGFWYRYADLARDYSPQLVVPRVPRARASAFIRFVGALTYVDGLEPPNLFHKLRTGRQSDVDIEISKLGPYAKEVEAQLRGQLPPNAVIEPATKSMAIRIHAPEIDHLRPFEEIAPDVIVGIQAASVLREWWNDGGCHLVADAVRALPSRDDGVNV